MRPTAAWLGWYRYVSNKLTICVLPINRQVLREVRRSIAVVLPMNRWALEVGRSIAVVLPMNRWALEVRRSIAVVLPMNRWALEVRRSIAVVLPMDRWALEVRRSIAVVLPMNRCSDILSVWPMVLCFSDAAWLFVWP